VSPDRDSIGLPPNKELIVDRSGYFNASVASKPEAFVRKLVALVFTFDEIFNSTVAGKRAKSGANGQLNSFKVQQILGKFSLVSYDFYLFYFILITFLSSISRLCQI
jgi:hypothetical protein